MAITRTLSIVYGGQTVPTTGTGYTVDVVDVHRVSMDYRTLSLEFTIVILGTGTDAQFATGLQALRAAFRTPNQDLTISMEGEDQFTGTKADHTFMDSRAAFSPVPEFSSARSAGLRVTIQGTLPADLAGNGGRFSGQIRTTRTPQEKRQVTITAEYSGLSGTDASGHEATFNAWAQAIVDAISAADFELSSPTSIQRDSKDTAATFTRIYTELLDDQSSSATNDTRLVNTRYRVTLDNSAAEIAGGQAGAPGQRVRVDFYSGFLASAGTAVSNLVESLILPFLETKAVLGGAGASLKLVNERINVDLAERVASGYVDYVSFDRSLVAAAVDQEEYEFGGRNVVSVLDGKSPYAADLHHGPGVRSMSVRIYTREIGKVPRHARRLEQAWIELLERQGWLHIDTRRPHSERDLTRPNGFVTQNFVESGAVLNFRYADLGKASGGGARQRRRNDIRSVSRGRSTL